ncbi:hypothetical protein F5X98DRAFT_366952 [Xylaria grammica]|nr:hypothetical protein F5X98DRAFT_366952 [Xylaria grammica]
MTIRSTRIISWLEGIHPEASTSGIDAPLLSPATGKRKRQHRHQQMATQTASKRRSVTIANDNDGDNSIDIDRTPRATGGKAWSVAASETGSRYSATSSSRLSPTKRLARLEVVAEHANPVSVQQINKLDPRIPGALKAMLKQLDGFQRRAGVVPGYLAAEIEARAGHDDNLDNFVPAVFGDGDGDGADGGPRIALHAVLKVFYAANECCNEDHAEATWNALVHWRVMDLALGELADVPEVPGGVQPQQQHPQPAPIPGDKVHNPPNPRVRVRGMPCTAARLTGHPQGSKMIDYCIFVEPEPETGPQGDGSAAAAARIDELRSSRAGAGAYLNHTDYHALRRRPIVLSAESKRPGEDLRNAQLQLSVWQAAQWRVLMEQVGAAGGEEGVCGKEGGGGEGGVVTMIPFLPALIIQGHDWYFAATTRSGGKTILWIRQPIGTTDSVLGIFQIICALRHVAGWICGTYWPWYRRAVLRLPGYL